MEKRRHDPFYLGDSKKRAVNPEDIDIDSIPIATLTSDDLKSGKGDRDSRRKGEKERRSKKKEVNRAEVNLDSGEMPEGALVSDDEDDKRGAKSGYTAFDVDLTTPLGKDEALPTVKAYGSPQDARKKAEQMLEEEKRKRTKEDEDRRRRHQDKKSDVKEKDRDKDRDKDRERSSRSSHHHRSERSERSDKERSGRSGDKPSSSSSEQGKKEAPKKAQENLLDFLGDDDAQPAAQDAPAAAPTSSSSSSRDKSERSDRERSSRHRDDRDKDRGRDRDRDRERRKPKEESAPSSSVQADLEGLGDLSESSSVPRGYTLLGEDAHARVLSRVRTSGSQEHEITLKVLIQNKGEGQVSSLELSVLDSMNLKCRSSKNGVIPLPSSSLPQGQTHEISVRFEVQDIAASQTLKATLAYAPQNEKDTKLDFKFPFPSSTFLTATPTSTSRPASSFVFFSLSFPFFSSDSSFPLTLARPTLWTAERPRQLCGQGEQEGQRRVQEV